MKQRPFVNLTAGLFVIAGIVALMMLALQVSGLTEFYKVRPEYNLTADFGNISGLKARARVTISGVNVGKVSSIKLDPETYNAVVSMNIYDSVKLPIDTVASIYTSGLIGDNYIALSPGGSDEYLKEGDQILETQNGLVLEELIGKLLFSVTGGDDAAEDQLTEEQL
jgi:phospholipid/cholesterol/gamma-HCH transport system substrate-binding protein